MNSARQIIGIDCAVNPRKTGIASGLYQNARLNLLDVQVGVKGKSVASCIIDLWKQDYPLLLAIDAPLGWPQSMSASLSIHKAGDILPVGANSLFRRSTDEFVHAKLKKQPLDIGADRIARTAHAALGILQEMRTILSMDIGLSWNPKSNDRISAIEVYPAATLIAHGISTEGYKSEQQERVRIVGVMRHLFGLELSSELLISSCDALDSVICLIAGKDFIEHNVYPPEDLITAKKEGWIWFKSTP